MTPERHANFAAIAESNKAEEPPADRANVMYGQSARQETYPAVPSAIRGLKARVYLGFRLLASDPRNHLLCCQSTGRNVSRSEPTSRNLWSLSRAECGRSRCSALQRVLLFLFYSMSNRSRRVHAPASQVRYM